MPRAIVDICLRIELRKSCFSLLPKYVTKPSNGSLMKHSTSHTKTFYVVNVWEWCQIDSQFTHLCSWYFPVSSNWTLMVLQTLLYVNVDYLLYSLIKINSPLSIFTVYLVFSSRAANHVVWFSHCLQRYDHVSKHGNYLRDGDQCDERPLSITEWWNKSWNQTKPEALIMCFWRDLISRKIKKKKS